MFELYANKVQLTVRRREPVTSGSVNAYEVHFYFSPDWDGLSRTAVFRCGNEEPVYVLLGEDNRCTIPWEVMTSYGRQLAVGVLGRRGEELVLPTIWAGLGKVLEGTGSGREARPPTPDLYEQILAVLTKKQEKLTGLPGQMVGFDETGNAVAQEPTAAGGTGGTTDHRQLNHRDGEDQHPMKAITGLEDALRHIPEPMTAEELQNILNGGNQNVEHP